MDSGLDASCGVRAAVLVRIGKRLCWVLAGVGLVGLCLSSAAARATAPQSGDVWVSDVVASSAQLNGEINPNGLFSSYRFEYISRAGYDANVLAGRDGFADAVHIPPGKGESIGSGSGLIVRSQRASSLSPETAYRYRLVAENSDGDAIGAAFDFVTQGFGGGALLPDGRGWEMVSPVDKNGGQVDPPGANAGGGVLQAAADGETVTYGSSASFATGAAGAPTASQYLSRRGSGSWSTANISVPLLSGSYGDEPDGVPYQLFSPDLARGLVLNGDHCRGGGEGCAVPNPPLAGTGAPAGYQNYYLRDSATGGFQALLGVPDLFATPLTPAQLDLRFAGASPDLRHVVLSTCAALTATAVEAPDPAGCDASEPNLYEWSAGGLTLVNVLPGQVVGSPGAGLAAQSRAVSADGSRVYWTDGANLYLREGGQTVPVDVDAGGGGSFETASVDGAVAYFTKGGHLYRYDAPVSTAADITPAGGVQGVLGASDDGSRVYYLTAAGLYLRDGATTTEVAAAADPVNYPPTSGSARVSPDGARLAFASSASLTGYDNTDDSETARAGEPDAEVFLYDATADRLVCVSCNPTNSRPIGPASIPGASSNGEGPQATRSYKPRALSADGRRLVFESQDALVLSDTNADARDVYQWEAGGTGSCDRPAGCVSLLSSGKGSSGASFVDASADGADVFLLTGWSLVSSDPGSVDLYDAREGGGFPLPPQPIACEGDACQPLPSEPEDQAVGTLIPGLGNPKVRYPKRRHHRHKHRRHGRSPHSANHKARGRR